MSGTLSQPYKLDYSGNVDQLKQLFREIDDMLEQLYNVSGSGSSGNTFVAGSGISITVVGSTVTITATGGGLTAAQVSTRVNVGL